MQEATKQQRIDWIEGIKRLPRQVEEAIDGLTEEQLGISYREQGWTLRQVVHHIAESTMHAYIRFRFALTEDVPTIQPFDEAIWAELADGRDGSVEDAVGLLTFLCRRWGYLMDTLTETGWERSFRHPEKGEETLTDALAFNAWHGKHHVAHIESCRSRNGF